MEKNFRIGQANELIRGDRFFDLHNQYDFSSLTIRADRTAQISFLPNPEHGTDEPSVTLEFSEINYLKLSPDFGTSSMSNLDEIGYMEPQQSDDEWILSEREATSVDHMLFRLGSEYVRIHAQRAQLSTPE